MIFIELKSIKEIAREFNVTTRTLRYYEEIGLIFPKRTESNQRLYSKKDVVVLKLIIRGKKYGFSLEEIKEMVLLFNHDRTGISQLERTLQYGEQKMQEIDHLMAELMEMKRELEKQYDLFNARLQKLKGDVNDEYCQSVSTEFSQIPKCNSGGELGN